MEEKTCATIGGPCIQDKCEHWYYGTGDGGFLSGALMGSRPCISEETIPAQCVIGINARVDKSAFEGRLTRNRVMTNEEYDNYKKQIGASTEEEAQEYTYRNFYRACQYSEKEIEKKVQERLGKKTDNQSWLSKSWEWIVP